MVSGADLCGLQSFALVGGVGRVAHAHRNRIRVTVPAGAVVAEVTIVVASPGVGVAVAAQGQRMIYSGADLQVGEVHWQVRVRLPVGCLHPDRRIPVAACPVAELAIAVVSPGVGVPVAAHGQRIRGSGADLQVGEVRWQVRVGLAVGCLHPDRRIPIAAACPVAELAIVVVSPGVGVAVAAQGQGILASGADLQVGEVHWQVRVRLPVGCLHPDRRMPLGGRPVAELAIAVVSPGVGVAVAAQGQRMIVSGADLQVGEILGQVRIRVAVGRLHPDRRIPVGAGCPVAELAIAVPSPGVGVPVAAHRQGKTIAVVFSSADLAEPDAPAGAVRRGDGGGFPAQLAALIGADAPRAVPACRRPSGGQGQVLVDGPAEIVGDLPDEPSVEQETVTRRVGGRPLHPAVWGGKTLVCWYGASSARVEMDRERRSWFGSSRQRPVDRIVEASGERLAVLPAGDEDDGFSRLAGGHVHLPRVVVLAERQCLAVHAG